MLEFSEEQIRKYAQSDISGTRFLAFSDIEKFAVRNKTDLSYVLGLVCGSGRSTNFISQFCGKVNGCDINKNAPANAIKKAPNKFGILKIPQNKNFISIVNTHQYFQF